MKLIEARWIGCVALGLGVLASCSSGKSAGGGTGGEGNVATGGSTGAGSGGQSAGSSGGASGSGGNGTAGSNGAGGSLTGAGGAISGAGGAITGAAGAGPLPGMACSGTSPITTAGTAATHLVVDAGQKGQAWNRFYEKV